MINLHETYDALEQSPLAPHLEALKAGVRQRFAEYRHGKLPEWLDILKSLPRVTPSHVSLQKPFRIGLPGDLTDGQRQKLEAQLRQFHPWRKGPFDLFGIHIDTEWRSDWKWDRLKDHISPLAHRMVLDVGCGNGYHCWRMAGEGAELVLGVDPSQLFLMQFNAIKHFLPEQPVHFLPVGIEHLPARLDQDGFDTVFSMGVLYHRRSPIDHLRHLFRLLRPGGELVLETLIIEGKPDQVLLPQDRYAQMRNVWFIPTPAMLTAWLDRCEFENARVVNLSRTTPDEQRSTSWMTFQSLEDFLESNNPDRTLEGYPAPRRAIVVAKRPE